MGHSHRSSTHISTPQSPPSDSRIHTSPLAQRHSSATPLQPQPTLGMSPAARYQHNLKVLRRRDPSILSIFDQFSHVCLYHHNGTKWEKQGYEGSMFLYERDSYPPYGFYILNRMGMDDHIQRLYPEDNISAHGSYLIIRSYPEYTARRLAIAHSSSSHGTPHKFSDVYAIPNIEKLTAGEKGEAQTIGLWMFTTDSREPLIDIFTRLHSYIKKNSPYPQEFRYGPDKPPPSNPPSRAGINAAPHLDYNTRTSHASIDRTSNSETEQDQRESQVYHPSQTYTNGSTSELAKLLAKIEPTPVIPLPTSTIAPQVPSSTSKMTVESLFAALGGQDLTQSVDTCTSSATPSSSTSITGISLLDSIFASAHNPTSRPATIQPSSNPQPITIHSPAPATTSQPQILTQDVISTLLGLPPSRTASAASTYSSDAQSHPTSREGDNEDESDDGAGRCRPGCSDGYSESSTVLDPDVEFDEELQSTGVSASRSLTNSSSYNILSNGHLANNGEHGRTLGDVTPRAPMNGFITPPLARPNHASRLPGAASLLPPSLSSVGSSSSVSTITGPQNPQKPKSPTQRHSQLESQDSITPADARRPVVPFEPNSKLWPCPPPVSDEPNPDTDEEEIIELDFEDTSALSDPAAFRRALLNGKGHSRYSSDDHGNHSRNVNGKEKGKARKNGRRERVIEQAKLPADVERSWDTPGSSALVLEGEVIPPPASPSPCPSPVCSPSPPRHDALLANHQSGAVNGTGPFTGIEQPKSSIMESVRESIGSAILARRPTAPIIERNDFIKEVLTLIHTDKTFMETLWRDYNSRV